MLQEIERKVQDRTVRLEQIIKDRQTNEQRVSGALTVASVVCIVVLWFKMQKAMKGKPGFGGSGNVGNPHML